MRLRAGAEPQPRARETWKSLDYRETHAGTAVIDYVTGRRRLRGREAAGGLLCGGLLCGGRGASVWETHPHPHAQDETAAHAGPAARLPQRQEPGWGPAPQA